jgi:hypothetical protein
MAQAGKGFFALLALGQVYGRAGVSNGRVPANMGFQMTWQYPRLRNLEESGILASLGDAAG